MPPYIHQEARRRTKSIMPAQLSTRGQRSTRNAFKGEEGHGYLPPCEPDHTRQELTVFWEAAGHPAGRERAIHAREHTQTRGEHVPGILLHQRGRERGSALYARIRAYILLS